LARVDVLLQREVRRWQLADQDPADTFRGLYVSDSKAEALLSRKFGTTWGTGFRLDQSEEAAFSRAMHSATKLARILVDEAESQETQPRLTWLAEAFALDSFDLDALLICLAPTLDLRYEQVYGYLQDDVTRKRPGISLVLDLLCEPGTPRLTMLSRFADDAPLIRNEILQRIEEPGSRSPPLLSQSLVVDEAVVAWLLGSYQPHASLAMYAELVSPQHTPQDRLLAGTAIQAEALWHCVQRADTDRVLAPLIAFHGQDDAAQDATARQLGAGFGRALLKVDISGTVESGITPLQAVRLALRDGRMSGALPYMTGWDKCLNEDGAPPPDILDALCRYPDLVVISGSAPWQAWGLDRDRELVRLEFPVPSFTHRLALWQHFQDGISGETLRLADLAGQFQLTTGQIRDAAASARDMAALRGESVQMSDLFAAARAHSNPRLAALARKIAPRFGWLDIVLPSDQLELLREIVSTVRGRPKVLEEWGVGQKLASSNGVTVLFGGPPGTGKTMAAEILAQELGLDLYKIDLSTVVSKYIGETEKNLERIFNEAERSNAILFFDEADALFGKRSEVRDSHDRYANIEISYLLQRMEAYDGVTILATNLRANLDEAFTRRLQFSVDFPFPEEEDRLRIWTTLFPPDVPRDADLDFPMLARRFKIAGGNIRNIIVAAAYLAAGDGQRVAMAHLLHGTRRELQKMGRLVGDDDLSVL
jgi:ATP-dependent 26S proteasome regulatory subunit